MIDIRVAQDVWLSSCLGVTCFSTNPKSSTSVSDIITQKDVVFITAKTSPKETHKARQLAEWGFVEINTQLTLKWSVDTGPCQPKSRKIHFVVSSAMDKSFDLVPFSPLFAKDRFRSDPRLPRDWSVRIKTHWLTEPDPGKMVVVAHVGAEIVGFVMIQPKPTQTVVDLIAVSPAHQGKGIGLGLLAHLQREICKEHEILVGTQHDNLAAQRLYRAAGFEFVESKHVYHFYREG